MEEKKMKRHSFPWKYTPDSRQKIQVSATEGSLPNLLKEL